MPSDFTPPSEELQRLSEEISLLRRGLQEGLASLNRIEKRLKFAFPDLPSKRAARNDTLSSASHAASSKSKSSEELLADFEAIRFATKERGDLGFESSIGNLSDSDVVALAHELGIGSLKTTSLKRAREGVRKRVQESLLLGFERKKST